MDCREALEETERNVCGGGGSFKSLLHYWWDGPNDGATGALSCFAGTSVVPPHGALSGFRGKGEPHAA